MSCLCKMERITNAFEINFLRDLKNVFYCSIHNTYHQCTGDDGCVFDDNGKCVFSGIGTSTVLRAEGYLNTDNLNPMETKLLKFRNKTFFRDIVHGLALRRHGAVLGGTVEPLTRPIMQNVLGGLHTLLLILFSPTKEETESFAFARNLASLSLKRRMERFDDALLKICDLFVEASLVDHLQKQEILSTLNRDVKHGKEMRGHIDKVISAVMTENVPVLPKPIV